jgi:hypothetical protein
MNEHKHKWELYGGLRENPGVHSSGGSIVIVSRCECGSRKREDYWNHRDNRPRKTASVTITREVAP